jgi:hypothetical protein
MKRLLIPMSLALGAVLLATAAPRAQESGSDRAYPIAAQNSVGPWTLAVANDDAGAFHHCELSRKQGKYQITFLRGTAGYVLVVVNADWRLPEGATYAVSLEGAGLDRVAYNASTASTGIIILLGDDWGLVDKLRNVGTLRLRTAQSVIPLPMDEAGTGIDRLEACWTQQTGAASNPFVSSEAESVDHNPFENSGAPAADSVADNSAAGHGGFTVTVPSVKASGANFSDSEIGAMFKGDFSRFADLTADKVLVPEITARFVGSDSGAGPVEVVYRDISFSGVAGGQAAGADVGSIELHAGKTGIMIDHMSTGRLNMGGLLAFYGLVPSGPVPDTPQLLYEDFAIDGVRIELPGAGCRLGAVKVAEFSGRPLRLTPAGAMQLMRDIGGANGKPTPEMLGGFARLYADYLTAFQSGPLQVLDVDCSAKNRNGRTVALTADRLGMGGLRPKQIPGIEARNLKLEVEGEDVFEARALILKPADASGLVATLLEAGDNPAPTWLADNARALIPAFAGLQLAGVKLNVPDTHTPGQRIRIGLTEADLSLGKYRNGIPSDVKMTVFGVDIPMTSKNMKPLADIGYPELDLGVALATHWNPDAGTIDIDQLTVSGQEIGTVTLVAALTNATPDLFSGDRARAIGAALRLGVQSIGIKAEDAGLRERLIAAGAKSSGLETGAFTKGLTRLVGQYVPQGRSWTDEMEQAAVAFIKGAPSVTLGLGAHTPVAAAQVIAAKSNPASLLDLFDVNVSVGR